MDGFECQGVYVYALIVASGWPERGNQKTWTREEMMPAQLFSSTRLLKAALLLLLGTNAGCWGSMSSTETVYSAEYSDMSFGGRQTYYSFGSGDEDSPEGKIAPVYFKLRDGKVFKLTDVSESMARDWSMLSKSEIARDSNIIKRKGRSGISLTSYRVALSSWFVFHEGKLLICSIDPGSPESPLRDVQIGKTADGEFLSFPIKRKDLVRVFGEPDRIEKGVIQHAY